VTEREETGIELLLSQPEIVAWLGLSQSGFFSDQRSSADEEALEASLGVGASAGRVTERPQSEEARLRDLIDNMPALIYLRDLDGRFILVNRPYQEFWGVPSDAIQGKTLAETDEMSDVDLTPGLNEQIDREVLATREPRKRESHVVRRGTEHVFTDVRFPVLDGAGQVVALAGIDLDITAQKRSEAELAELLRRVEMARDAAIDTTAAKSRLLANMSHELRTPLNAIIGFTRIVSRNAQTLPTKQVDNLSKILVSAEHLLALIDEIVDLSRIEAGHVRVDITETSVADMLQEITDSLEPLVDRSRVRLAVEAGPGLHAIATDRDKLNQILHNLVSNAVKYTHEGSIEVRSWRVDGRLRVSVSDTGVGIAGNELERIFEEFYRADAKSAPQRRGTGLGLSISRRLAKVLGGDITVASRPGIGSTFTLDLPVS
jgi:PAS domain S-box-containing protein